MKEILKKNKKKREKGKEMGMKDKEGREIEKCRVYIYMKLNLFIPFYNTLISNP